MSVRSSQKPGSQTTGTIDFKEEFVNSPAALAANHDDTVNHILSRLDQLQSKIVGQSANDASSSVTLGSSASNNSSNNVNSKVAAVRKSATEGGAGDLHSRLSALENIHEDSLRRLSVKLDGLEKQLSTNKEAEVLMGRIASKFGAIESQLNNNKEAEALMGRISSKFTQLESRLKSTAELHDRVSDLESRVGSHSRLSERLSTLESRVKSDLHSRVCELESRLEPDPEQERILARINSKLDILERNAAAKRNGASLMSEEPRLSADYSSRRSMDGERKLGAEGEGGPDRVKYLQERIGKLKELRAKYEQEE